MTSQEVQDSTKKQSGAPPHPVWREFTNDDKPWLRNESICKKCKKTVKHHKKTPYVIKHIQIDCPIKTDLPANVLQRSSTLPIRTPPISPVSESSTSPRSLNQELCEHHFAMFFFTSGTSFYRAENEHLIELLTLLNPNFVIPNRQKLAAGLLNKCHEKTVQHVEKQNQNQRLSISTDSYTNVNGESVTNYIGINQRGESYFLHAGFNEKKNAQSIAENVGKSIDSQKNPVSGVTMDNTNANRAASQILSLKYPSTFFIGCSAHNFHLLCQDFSSASKTLINSGYPLTDLSSHANNCSKIVSFFNQHSSLKVALNGRLKTLALKHLAATAPTRWGSSLATVTTVTDAYTSICDTIDDHLQVSGLTESQRNSLMEIKTILGEEVEFKNKSNKYNMILSPVVKLIVKYESDSVPLSELFEDFADLHSYYLSLDLPPQQIAYLSSRLEYRWNFIKQDVHLIANMLDPRFLGHRLPGPETRFIETKIIGLLPGRAPENVVSELDQLQQLCRSTSWLSSPRHSMLVNKKISVFDVWNSLKEFPSLQELAARVFTCVASSSSSERNFSTFGFIHNKLRNSLGWSTVIKLVFIKQNTRFSKKNMDGEDFDEYFLEAKEAEANQVNEEE